MNRFNRCMAIDLNLNRFLQMAQDHKLGSTTWGLSMGIPKLANGDTEKNMGFWGTVKHFQTKPYLTFTLT